VGLASQEDGAQFWAVSLLRSNTTASRAFLDRLAGPEDHSNTATTLDNRRYSFRRLCADFAFGEQSLCATITRPRIADDDAQAVEKVIPGRGGGLRAPAPANALPRAAPRRTAARGQGRPPRCAAPRQLRETLSPYCDVNGCVVPETDESSGFGGIIAPPWWDDFQEP
jgi:hypothetical protein